MTLCPAVPLEVAAAQALHAGDAALALAYGRAALIVRPLSAAGDVVWAAAAQLDVAAGPHVALIVLAWLGLATACTAAAAAALWWRRARVGAATRRPRWATLLLLSLWLGLTVDRAFVARWALPAAPIAARVLPESNANEAVSLAAGALLRVRRTQGAWAYVRGDDGAVGWVPAAALHRPHLLAHCD